MLHALTLLSALWAVRAFAQTETACQPLNQTCPDDPALGTTFNATWNSDSTEFDPNYWNITAGNSLISYGDNGASFAIAESGQSVTAVTQFYIFWGTVEIIMKAAAGQGIISTLVLLSDDLDEIDLEIMGGNYTAVETNWYGHGNRSQYNAKYHAVDGPQNTFHNYTIVWNQDVIEWHVDGGIIRTLPAGPSGRYPQTPSFIRFGVWAGGDKSEQQGTIEWAGGLVDWSKGPFTMEIASIKITDGSTNMTTYAYGDHSGSWQSIQATPGQSKFYDDLHQTTFAQNAQKSWNGLSKGAKIGIACAVLGVLLIAAIAFGIFCVKQRRAGRAERIAADRIWNLQQAETEEYRNRMARSNFAVDNVGHGEKH